MAAHIIDGEFQSDKYPTCPRGKVPLSVKDPTAQDLLWEYAQRRRSVDEAFSDDLETALGVAGFRAPYRARPHRSGGLCRSVPDNMVGKCGQPEHEGHGAMCFGCAISLGRDERHEAVEECLRVLASIGDFRLLKRAAQEIREHFARADAEVLR